jgi:hypothetical protein
VSKRPSFLWLQYQSPRKGVLTIFAIVGSFYLTWTPTVARAVMDAFGGVRSVWFDRIAQLLLITRFVNA